MTSDRILCGWRVRSNVPLPELLPWPGPASSEADVTITAAPIERQEEERTGYLHVRPDGSVLFQVPGLVRILTRHAREMIVDVECHDTTDSWRLFLLGTALNHLCLQRGCLPLHAATLRIGGRTVALAGQSGQGKSTLAAILGRRGHKLLSDDVAVLDVGPGPGITVRPAFPRLRLWRDTLDALSLYSDSLVPVREGIGKYTLDVSSGFDPAPAPLDAVIVLRKGETPALRRHGSAESVALLQSHVQRYGLVELLGRRAAVFAQTAAVAGAVPVLSLERPLRFETLEAMADMVEEALAA